MRRAWVVAGVAALAVAANAGAAALVVAANARSASVGETLCVSKAHKPITAPSARGHCRKGQTAMRLGSQTEVSTLAGEIATLQRDNTALKSQIATVQSQVATLQSDVTTLRGDVATLKSTLTPVSYSPKGLNGLPTLTISGANLQIVSGSGSTYATPSGLGNLIIGYDEHGSAVKQTGSHNLVLGQQQTFTSYGGVIGGYQNTLSGPLSAVFGQYNTAGAGETSVTGGVFNTAGGGLSSVSGGESNTASGADSAILGGNGNTVSGNCGTFPSTGQSC